jgi:predicted enzyme related to lactoylglutathione lyase
VTRSAAFYQDVFGWPRNERIDYDEYVELTGPDGTLGLCERATYERLTGATPMAPENGDVSPAYLYVRVPDVRAAIVKLREAGARPLAPLARVRGARTLHGSPTPMATSLPSRRPRAESDVALMDGAPRSDRGAARGCIEN